MIDSHSCSDFFYIHPHHHITQRFSEVHALHQTLLRCPSAKAAAKGLVRLAPRKTMTWSALLASDTRDATIAKRMVQIPQYLNAVLADGKVRVGGGWSLFGSLLLWMNTQSLLPPCRYNTTAGGAPGRAKLLRDEGGRVLRGLMCGGEIRWTLLQAGETAFLSIDVLHVHVCIGVVCGAMYDVV